MVKRKAKKKRKTSKSNSTISKQILKSNIELQKTTLQLVENINKLTKRTDKLLGIFEEASKHVSEVSTSDEKLAHLAAKLESLLESNKELAKGLLLLERYVREKGYVRGFEPRSLPSSL